ncbi:hypothetical protein Taro_017910 [Colocasia esculenta]|uniref:Uncharacterized protein n=1 Tax=Colocasia esculenta TaxID=4460 RepID=A0A843UUM7_COLES|nr:hypothetical protein [Colocasia esculenta]
MAISPLAPFLHCRRQVYNAHRSAASRTGVLPSFKQSASPGPKIARDMDAIVSSEPCLTDQLVDALKLESVSIMFNTSSSSMYYRRGVDNSDMNNKDEQNRKQRITETNDPDHDPYQQSTLNKCSLKLREKRFKRHPTLAYDDGQGYLMRDRESKEVKEERERGEVAGITPERGIGVDGSPPSSHFSQPGQGSQREQESREQEGGRRPRRWWERLPATAPTDGGNDTNGRRRSWAPSPSPLSLPTLAQKELENGREKRGRNSVWGRLPATTPALANGGDDRHLLPLLLLLLLLLPSERESGDRARDQERGWRQGGTGRPGGFLCGFAEANLRRAWWVRLWRWLANGTAAGEESAWVGSGPNPPDGCRCGASAEGNGGTRLSRASGCRWRVADGAAEAVRGQRRRLAGCGPGEQGLRQRLAGEEVSQRPLCAEVYERRRKEKRGRGKALVRTNRREREKTETEHRSENNVGL